MINIYRCPASGCRHHPLKQEENGLRCDNGHFYSFVENTHIPVFAKAQDDINEYTLHNAAEVHDNSLRWVFDTLGSDESSLRTSLVNRLRLKSGDRVLVTGAGAGNDLPFIAEMLQGKGEIFAQDIAQQMLVSGAERHSAYVSECGIEISFSVSDATNLPFGDKSFDAAYHFGGVNLFPDVKKGIAEMNRVVKPGGRVLVSDEGLAPWLVDSELGKMLIENNSLYKYPAPLSSLPETARNVHVSWELSNCFYVIDFEASDVSLDINIDVPHVGLRGGSIRTRYYGKLEGITPELRDRIYEEAHKKGISRVDYIEALLREGMKKDG